MAYRGLGLTQKAADLLVKKSAQDLDSQRRLFEADQAQAAAQASSEELQGTVMKWLPRVGIGVAAVLAGYLIWKKTRKG